MNWDPNFTKGELFWTRVKEWVKKGVGFDTQLCKSWWILILWLNLQKSYTPFWKPQIKSVKDSPFFSHKSDSKITNVHLSVSQSFCQSVAKTLVPLRIMHISYYSCLLIITIRHMSFLISFATTGCPKKMVIRKGFEFLTLGGVFLGVKNNSKNFGNKKILGCLAKFWVKGPCFIENIPIFFNFHDFVSFKRSKIIWKVKIFKGHKCISLDIDFYMTFRVVFHFYMALNS